MLKHIQEDAFSRGWESLIQMCKAFFHEAHKHLMKNRINKIAFRVLVFAMNRKTSMILQVKVKNTYKVRKKQKYDINS